MAPVRHGPKMCAHLVLAVSVATGGATGHLDGIACGGCRVGGWGVLVMSSGESRESPPADMRGTRFVARLDFKSLLELLRKWRVAFDWS